MRLRPDNNLNLLIVHAVDRVRVRLACKWGPWSQRLVPLPGFAICRDNSQTELDAPGVRNNHQRYLPIHAEVGLYGHRRPDAYYGVSREFAHPVYRSIHRGKSNHPMADVRMQETGLMSRHAGGPIDLGAIELHKGCGSMERHLGFLPNGKGNGKNAQYKQTGYSALHDGLLYGWSLYARSRE